jgi:hypothetical protein
MKSTKPTYKIQANVENYTNYVVEKLIGIEGTSKSDVVSFIMKDWIKHNQDFLEKSKCGVMHWREENSDTN